MDPKKTITYEGNKLTIEIGPNSLGDVAVTDGVERIECFWDGTQWVCNIITFGPTPSRD